MIPSIGKGLLTLIILPFFLIASPYYHFNYWITNERVMERGGYRGSWYTYKKNMKEILFYREWDL